MKTLGANSVKQDPWKKWPNKTKNEWMKEAANKRQSIWENLWQMEWISSESLKTSRKRSTWRLFLEKNHLTQERHIQMQTCRHSGSLRCLVFNNFVETHQLEKDSPTNYLQAFQRSSSFFRTYLPNLPEVLILGFPFMFSFTY